MFWGPNDVRKYDVYLFFSCIFSENSPVAQLILLKEKQTLNKCGGLRYSLIAAAYVTARTSRTGRTSARVVILDPFLCLHSLSPNPYPDVLRPSTTPSESKAMSSHSL